MAFEGAVLVMLDDEQGRHEGLPAAGWKVLAGQLEQAALVVGVHVDDWYWPALHATALQAVQAAPPAPTGFQ